ncbi:MAG: AraC family transcriptional regulator [Oscillospiraceae bacterium]|nr:AraC family transcriptional regulator [Oscillospiraceae bacterium]
MHWIPSITQALHYIESSITQDIGVDDVAGKVYASSANFQRIFNLVTGMTIGDYIRSRRLSLAAQDILAGQKLIDVAMKYQYDTQESFSKAFTRFHGVTPSGLRKTGTGAKLFHPLTINITIQGGFNMERNVIPNIHMLIKDDRGENYWFNGCAAYAMESLGEPDYNYWFFAGLTGDIFTQMYTRDPTRWNACAAAEFLMGPEYAQWVFDQIGYACEYVTKQELLANKEHYLRRLMDSINRGVPVISVDWGMFVGYEDGGKTLLFMTHEWTEPKRVAVGGEHFFENISQSETERGHHFNAFDLIFIGEKQRHVPLAILYREAMERLPKLLTTKTDDYVFGAQAFRDWADDIEGGKYDAPGMLHDEPNGDPSTGKWWVYTNYVCVLATNGSCCFSFLKKARELNPDMAWLKKIARLYKKMGRMWNGKFGSLEKLGGGFNITWETLQNPKKRAKIVAKIREFADVTDEVVRVLEENLQ